MVDQCPSTDRLQTRRGRDLQICQDCLIPLFKDGDDSQHRSWGPREEAGAAENRIRAGEGVVLRWPVAVGAAQGSGTVAAGQRLADSTGNRRHSSGIHRRRRTDLSRSIGRTARCSPRVFPPPTPWTRVAASRGWRRPTGSATAGSHNLHSLRPRLHLRRHSCCCTDLRAGRCIHRSCAGGDFP